jgi:hypothetical protein
MTNAQPLRQMAFKETGIDKYALFHQCFADRTFYNYTGRVETL